MKRNFYWKALFSQSGTEILEISNQVGRFPDSIITNKPVEDIDKINPKLLEAVFDRLIFLPKLPSVEEYKQGIKQADIVTLHGFLRILPPTICNRYKIYNGHPGLITLYPELKGKDPQMRVWNGFSKKPYKNHGHVIHKVISEVDAGEIITTKAFYSENIYLDFITPYRYISKLHDIAVENWVEFVKKQITINTSNYAY